MLESLLLAVAKKTTKDFKEFIRLLTEKLREYKKGARESGQITRLRQNEKRDTRQESGEVSKSSDRRRSSEIHGSEWSDSSSE